MSALPEERPDHREQKLVEIRREAEQRGFVSSRGVMPSGAPIPRASEQTGYYGMPLLKEPQWQWEIPLYFFVGGAAGSSAVIGAMADWIGDDYELASHARWLAVGGVGLSSALLIADLGRPSRFLNMLRVIKLQSPMSVGAWVLSAFGSMAAATAFVKAVQKRWDWLPIRIVGNLAQFGSATLGLPFHNYTGVLIGATVIPAWNRNIKTLPIHFGMSGVQAACSILELAGHSDKRALNLLALAAAGWETYEGVHLETRQERVLHPLKRGASGWITRLGGVLSGPLPLALRSVAALVGTSSSQTKLRRTAALCGIAGSLLTRYGWVQAGHSSAKDWRQPLEIGGAEITPLAEPPVEIKDLGVEKTA
ncbi:MAG TPA: NrfD/PsrC family molybdoenzyme membrane anchor subunit [Terriglobales bacterium]|nr:NrfD/PsrC family molybdoenzyme membrane anchor subunit [Terriglobales bacterium]